MVGGKVLVFLFLCVSGSAPRWTIQGWVFGLLLCLPYFGFFSFALPHLTLYPLHHLFVHLTSVNLLTVIINHIYSWDKNQTSINDSFWRQFDASCKLNESFWRLAAPLSADLIYLARNDRWCRRNWVSGGPAESRWRAMVTADSQKSIVVGVTIAQSPLRLWMRNRRSGGESRPPTGLFKHPALLSPSNWLACVANQSEAPEGGAKWSSTDGQSGGTACQLRCPVRVKYWTDCSISC